MMPSLIKYFSIVGALLFAGLIGLNAILDPGGPGPTIVKAQDKVTPIRHDPRASLVERLRDEEAAREAAARGEVPAKPNTPTIAAAAPAPLPAPEVATQAAAMTPPAPTMAASAPAAVAPAPAAEPSQVSAAAALTSGPTEEEAAHATRLAKQKIAAEKARKKRVARSKAKAIEEASASRQQDQMYYGYAPRPNYGPFQQGGGGWGQRW